MKNRKSLMKNAIALAIAVVMCVTMLPTAAFAAEPAKTIRTKQDLIDLAAEVNGGKTYRNQIVVLAADINLGGDTLVPIGTWDHSFQGTFDGAKSATENYTISNGKIAGDDTYIRAGLFGCIRYGTVQNLTLDAIEVANSSSSNSGNINGVAHGDSDESATGVAVGTLRSGSIINVHVTDNCSVSGHFRTGGIVGDTRGTSSFVTNCINEANVTSDNLYTGGIVGAAHDVAASGSATGTRITGCNNMGTVTGTTNVGGIVGYADRTIVTSCNNEKNGTVTGRGNYGTGGIVGANVYNYTSLAAIIQSYYPTVSSTIDDCHNYGNVIGGRAGGILGAYIAAPGEISPGVCSTAQLRIVATLAKSQERQESAEQFLEYQISYAKGDASGDVERMGVVIQNCTFNCIVNEATAEVATPSAISIKIS